MKQEIEKKLEEALTILLSDDQDILRIDVNERTITHRLAIYLEQHFIGWNVDCEYNRDNHDSKRLDIKRLNIKSDDSQASTVYPDIIVHKRGTRENLLVIEMKKTTSRVDDNYDIGKLRAFKKQLGYCFAVFIKLKIYDTPEIEKIEWI